MVDHDNHEHLRRIFDLIFFLELIDDVEDLLFEVFVIWLGRLPCDDFAGLHSKLSLACL